MADSRSGFFSGLSGFIAGVAGLLTALVAVAGLAVQQGWVGGGSVDGTTGTEGADRGAPTAAVPAFEVEPASLSFQPVGSRDAEVRVRNTGAVPLRLEPPTVTGDDAERFDVDEGTCAGPLAPGRSCALRVRFDPGPGNFSALVVVEAEKAAQAREVPVKASGVF